jgi:hypothetical protein
VFNWLGLTGIDVIGDGLFVVAPPSTVGDTGYDWLYSPQEVAVAEAPPWLVLALRLVGRHEARPKALARQEGPRERTDGPVTGHAPPAKPTRTDKKLLLADIVRRYPVGSEGSRNPQMSRAVASLMSKGLPVEDVKGLLVQWHEHFVGSYQTPMAVAVREIASSIKTLEAKIKSGRFRVGARNHAVEQSKLALTPHQEEFLARLCRPPADPLSSSTMVEQDKTGRAVVGRKGYRRLSVAEEQFVEALLLLVSYKRARGEADDHFLATNQQMIDLLVARFGIEGMEAHGKHGRQFRRLKESFVTKARNGKELKARKAELVVMVEEGVPGTPSKYQMTRLLEAFAEDPPVPNKLPALASPK